MDITITVEDSVGTDFYANTNPPLNEDGSLQLTAPADIASFIAQYFLKQIRISVVKSRTEIATQNVAQTIESAPEISAIDTQINNVDASLSAVVSTMPTQVQPLNG